MDNRLDVLIGVAIGQASMCWQYPNHAGIFQSNAAAMVGAELARDVEALYSSPVQCKSEIDRLANFIMAEFPREPGRVGPPDGESAVDVAIRLMTDLKASRGAAKAQPA